MVRELLKGSTAERGSGVERNGDGVYVMGMGDATAIDNYLILQVKMGKFAENETKLKSVQREKAEYQPVIDALLAQHPDLQDLMGKLQDIHEKLWYIEDRKREIEQGEEPDVMIARLLGYEDTALLVEYLKLSRDVSKFNDIRASLKRQMNIITGSVLVEVKSHRTVA